MASIQAEQQVKVKPTLSDLMRLWFKGVLDPVGGALNRLGLMPNTVTLIGLAGTSVGGLLLAQGNLFLGGLLIFAMAPVDALDGTMARLRGERSDFGAFVDSVTDRYSELLTYGALVFYFASTGETLGLLLAYAAAAGAVLVSYVRAKAEGLGFDARGGVLTRLERYLILGPALLLGAWFPRVTLLGLGVIAVLANLTALQRILAVRRQARQQKGLR
jgi:CDP-diacylglycerol--glycerol-3-phosphate 3-phosphatidyltransferase